MLPDFLPFFDPILILLTIVSGLAVGLSLGLTGGGGSILAVPLLIYVVGVKDPHAAIGTSALVVGVIAATSMISHRMHGHLRIKEGLMFAVPGVGGTLIGTQLGLLTPANNLLLLFAAFMVVMGYRTFTRKPKALILENHTHGTVLLQKNRLVLSGFLVGIAAGYFGIGGGFLIVPALMHSAGFDIIDAIGTSLLPVSAFGLSTAARYFIEGQISLLVVALFVVGGIVGGFVGTKFAAKIPQQKLLKVFGILLFLVSAYIVFRVVIS